MRLGRRSLSMDRDGSCKLRRAKGRLQISHCWLTNAFGTGHLFLLFERLLTKKEKDSIMIRGVGFYLLIVFGLTTVLLFQNFLNSSREAMIPNLSMVLFSLSITLLVVLLLTSNSSQRKNKKKRH